MTATLQGYTASMTILDMTARVVQGCVILSKAERAVILAVLCFAIMLCCATSCHVVLCYAMLGGMEGNGLHAFAGQQV